MYITNKPEIARIAENAGVDRIFVDLEIIGKEERQGHLDTVISRHKIEDVTTIKEAINKSQLLVRVNPIYENSNKEIDEVINRGADIVMLPMFKSKKEVEKFIGYVNGRVKVCLLLETKEAVERLNDILKVKGIDEIHIGLNDLHLAYKKKFMFELLTNGMVEKICNEIKKTNINYGFGGIASIGKGDIKAEMILKEHYRLGSSQVILSRSFCNVEKVNTFEEIEEIFNLEVNKVRELEAEIKEYIGYFNENKNLIESIVKRIIS